MTATTLAGKIAQASIDAGAFKADKVNTDQNYSYISADQVLSRAGDALARQGVIMIPHILLTTITLTERAPDRGGNPRSPRIDAHINFSMVLTDGDKEISFPWEGYGSDYMTPDKAIYKAITSGHKYALMKILNIGIGNEDGEHESDRSARDEDELEDPSAPMTIEEARALPVARGARQRIGDLTKPALDALLIHTKSEDVRLAVSLVIKHDFNMTVPTEAPAPAEDLPA